MNEKIKILVKYAGEPAAAMEIDNDYRIFMDIVGGLPGMTGLPKVPGATITYNDTGLIDGLTPNIRWGDGHIAGNIIIAGDNYGETVSLTPEQITQATQFLSDNDISGAKRSPDIYIMAFGNTGFAKALSEKLQKDYDGIKPRIINNKKDFEM